MKKKIYISLAVILLAYSVFYPVNARTTAQMYNMTVEGLKIGMNGGTAHNYLLSKGYQWTVINPPNMKPVQWNTNNFGICQQTICNGKNSIEEEQGAYVRTGQNGRKETITVKYTYALKGQPRYIYTLKYDTGIRIPLASSPEQKAIRKQLVEKIKPEMIAKYGQPTEVRYANTKTAPYGVLLDYVDDATSAAIKTKAEEGIFYRSHTADESFLSIIYNIKKDRKFLNPTMTIGIGYTNDGFSITDVSIYLTCLGLYTDSLAKIDQYYKNLDMQRFKQEAGIQ